MDYINMSKITIEFILFAVVFLIATFGIYFFMRRYWKEKFIRISLIITGLFWILFGYIQLKYGVLMRIWAVIGAPYNQFALQEFLSYDVLPILAILLTGASFILYSSILLKNPTRTPLKWFMRIILYTIISSGILMSVMQFIRVYYLIIHFGNFGNFIHRYDNSYYLQDYLFPLFVLFTGFCVLELVRLKTNLKTENTGIQYRANKMILLPITALAWIGAGIVNLIVKLLKEHNVMHRWEWDGSFMEVVFGIADYFVIEQLFYILIGILLFIIWTWNIPNQRIGINFKMKYLFDEPHWEIDKIGKHYDVSLFFLKLTLLFSNNVYLAIIDGYYSLEMMAFIQSYSLQNMVLPLHREFDKADIIPINEKTMDKLAELATRHAGPEIAGHLAVSSLQERLLEWFDFPSDPIAVSPSISEESINRFCVDIGAKYKIWG